MLAVFFKYSLWFLGLLAIFFGSFFLIVGVFGGKVVVFSC
jgi:hypothetical protein